jgi:hypothetical protein
VTLAATPVSAAAEQQHDYDNDQEQFHLRASVVGVAALSACRPAVVGQPAQS